VRQTAKLRGVSLLLAIAVGGSLYLMGCRKEATPAEMADLQRQEMQAQQKVMQLEESGGAAGQVPAAGQAPAQSQQQRPPGDL